MLRQVATRGLLGRLVGAECAGYAGVAGTNSAFLSTSPRMQEGDVGMDAFKKQQVQYKVRCGGRAGGRRRGFEEEAA